jgi:hypothetical protein
MNSGAKINPGTEEKNRETCILLIREYQAGQKLHNYLKA